MEYKRKIMRIFMLMSIAYWIISGLIIYLATLNVEPLGELASFLLIFEAVSLYVIYSSIYFIVCVYYVLREALKSKLDLFKK